MLSRVIRLFAAFSVLLVPMGTRSESNDDALVGAVWRRLETVRIPVETSIAGYAAIIEQSADSEDSPRVTIVGPIGPPLSVRPAGGMVRVAEALEFNRELEANSLGSQYLYTSLGLRSRFYGQILLAFGHGHASDPGSIYVIGVGHGPATLIFHDETFELAGIENLSHGGDIRLIGHRSLTQLYGDCLSTYDPFSVFELSKSGGFTYSLPLSRQYNFDHNYVWAGRAPREDVAVDHCSSRPRLVTGAELKRRK